MERLSGGAVTIDRCPLCGFAASGHVRADGSWLGCPARLYNDSADRNYPRFQIRTGTGPVRGRLYAIWADCRIAADSRYPEGQILVWDLESGDQQWHPAAWLRNNTKRANPDEADRGKQEVEYQIGEPIRLVTRANGWKGA